MSAGEESGYNLCKEAEISRQNTSKSHAAEQPPRRVRINDRSAVRQQESEEDGMGKSRRTAVQNKKDYYEEICLQVNQQRAKKYWNVLDGIYFKRTTVDCLRDVLGKMMELSESYELLEDQYNLHRRLLKYKDYVFYKEYPGIQNQQSSIKTLFQSQGKDPFLVFYQVEDSSEVSKNQGIEDPISLAYAGRVKVDPTLFQQNFSFEECELDKEITLWENLNERNMNNNRMEWQKLKSKVLLPERKDIMSQEEVDLIKEKLYWSTILKLFIEGHRDKTSGVFQYYNIKDDDSDPQSGFKTKKRDKKFETDCKICFCSSNNESNMVVYCDICNTSFHVICYGLKTLPNSQKYYCQVCTEFKLVENKDRPNCKICEKKYFPMKKMDNHYYHVTCMVLNNLVEFRNMEMRLRKDVTFKSISNMVINSQITMDNCYYCESGSGLRFACNHQDCRVTFHPICGYLNGCLFDMKRSSSSSPANLDVKVSCVNHDPNRNYTQQVYYRRFVCDYKKTSQFTLQQFTEIYKIQMSQYLEKNKRRPNPWHQILSVNKSMKETREKVKATGSKGCKMRTEVSKLMKSRKTQDS